MFEGLFVGPVLLFCVSFHCVYCILMYCIVSYSMYCALLGCVFFIFYLFLFVCLLVLKEMRVELPFKKRVVTTRVVYPMNKLS